MALFKKPKDELRIRFVNEIFKNSLKAADSIRELARQDKENENISDEDWVFILFGFINLYLHATDRIAYNEIGDKQRSMLMKEIEIDTISSAVEGVCHSWPETARDEFKNKMLGCLEADIDKYSQYKEWTKEVVWEFGKVISSLATKNRNDAMYIIATQDIVAQHLKNLDIKSFIKKIK